MLKSSAQESEEKLKLSRHKELEFLQREKQLQLKEEEMELSVQRRFRIVPERGNRVLRVACVETDTEIRILSAFLDRRARRPS